MSTDPATSTTTYTLPTNYDTLGGKFRNPKKRSSNHLHFDDQVNYLKIEN